MRDAPDIVKELREKERLGSFSNSLNNTPQDMHESKKVSNDAACKTTLSHDEDFKNSVSDGQYDNRELTNVIENSIMLFEISPETIIIIDNKGNILDINARIYDWLGYEREELIGDNLFNLPFFADKYKNNIFDLSTHTILSEKALSYELDFITKNGEQRTGSVHAVPIKNRNNKISGGLIMISDVTESKTEKEEINKLSQFQDSVIDNANVWLSAMNLIGNVVIWNKAAEAITGYPRGEVLGHNSIWDWLTPDEKQCKRDITTKRVSHIGGEVFSQNFETLIKRKDGNIKTVSWDSCNILDNTKNPIGSITLGLDITEQKRSEEEIKRQNTELKRLNRIKSDFLNVTSHELRTPMVAIKGYVQLLSDFSLGEITDKQKKALNVVLRNTNRLNKLVQDILDVSRLESGTMKFIPEDTDIGKMTKETAETMQSSANEKQMKINTILEDNLPSLIIDSERVKQVLVNLVNNAIKFSPCNSDINIQVKKERDYISFEVQDFGRGIPKNKIEKIFDTFYQVDCVKDRKLMGGAGLGLAISRGIVVAHGGNICVESKVNKGSTFKFTLPLKLVEDIEDRFKKLNIFSPENFN